MKKISIFLLLLCLTSLSLNSIRASAAGKHLNVMFLHDTHSHLEPFSTVEGEKTVTAGGFSRIKTLINRQKEQDADTLLLDGGDFSMGTLVQTVFSKEAPELRMLGDLGMDVTTFGNHEYDYRASGLASMLHAAQASGDPIPQIVLCNVDWDAMKAEELNEDQALLLQAFQDYGVKDYTIITKGNVRIAVTGVFGHDSVNCAPTCVLSFKDPVEAVKETVAVIKEKEAVDMIVCVSHSGTWDEESEFDPSNLSEDELLAKGVPELDLIVSGHTHTLLTKPVRMADTYIVSSGEYGKQIGSLSMTQQENGRWSMDSYDLLPVTEDLPEDAATEQKIQDFMKSIDTDYLSRFGYTSQQVLAENDVTFSTIDDLYSQHEEHNLGDFIADAYAYAVNNSSSGDSHPVDVAIAPSGTIRDTYIKGDLTVTDVFNSFSLGIGEDQIPGYPLVSAYLTGSELRTIAEIDASLSDLMTAARLYMNGLSMSYNPHRLILDRVTDCYLTDTSGQRLEIQNDQLYRVVTDLYSCQMLKSVTSLSHGLLSIVPKNADGTKAADINDLILTEQGGELKAWDAIARYMQSFSDPDGNGIRNIPEDYASLQGRKVVEDSRKLSDLLRKPGRYARMFAGVVTGIVVFLALIVTLIIRKRKKA